MKKDLHISIETLTRQLTSLSLRVGHLEKENAELRQQLNTKRDGGEAVPGELHAVIDKLKAVLNDREQIGLANELEISGILELPNESCEHIVTALALKLRVELDERDIACCSRAGPRRLNATSSDGATVRPRPIVARFTRHCTRNQFLQSARVRRGATTAELGLPPHTPQKLYVNERLTKQNRMLFGKAKEAARSKKWNFVWTRDGRVLAKKENGQPTHRILNDSDIERVFCSDPISTV